MSAGYANAAEAATAMGVPASTYLHHEAGRRAYSPRAAARYAAAFGRRPEWLLYGDGPAAALQTGGARLRFARRAAGLSRIQLADAVGYSTSSIGALENGQNRLRPEVAFALAFHLGVTAEWLLYGAEGPHAARVAAQIRPSKAAVSPAVDTEELGPLLDAWRAIAPDQRHAALRVLQLLGELVAVRR